MINVRRVLKVRFSEDAVVPITSQLLKERRYELLLLPEMIQSGSRHMQAIHKA